MSLIFFSSASIPSAPARRPLAADLALRQRLGRALGCAQQAPSEQQLVARAKSMAEAGGRGSGGRRVSGEGFLPTGNQADVLVWG